MKSKTSVFVSVLMISQTLLAGTYSGGSGEPNDPYRIATAEDLNDIGNEPNDWDKHFLLVADINLADYVGRRFNIIGNTATKFTGVFVGDGHTICNFAYDSSGRNDIGIFGCVGGASAVIKDIGVIDPNVNAGTGRNAGSLVGVLADGTVTSCYAEGGKVWGYTYVGGLVGNNNSGTISKCHATDEVGGEDWVGGLAGYNGRVVSRCYATGDVFGGDGAIEVPGVGGLVGYNGATISNCYATGDVSSRTATGGLVGSNHTGMIYNCYATGYVSSEVPAGLTGDSSHGSVTDSFWDTETTGTSWSAGGEGRTTAQMKTRRTFADAGWDFVEVWGIGEDQTYPFLRTYPDGDINHDDKVNFADVAILAEHWLQGAEP